MQEKVPERQQNRDKRRDRGKKETGKKGIGTKSIQKCGDRKQTCGSGF